MNLATVYMILTGCYKILVWGLWMQVCHYELDRRKRTSMQQGEMSILFVCEMSEMSEK